MMVLPLPGLLIIHALFLSCTMRRWLLLMPRMASSFYASSLASASVLMRGFPRGCGTFWRGARRNDVRASCRARAQFCRSAVDAASERSQWQREERLTAVRAASLLVSPFSRAHSRVWCLLGLWFFSATASGATLVA